MENLNNWQILGIMAAIAFAGRLLSKLEAANPTDGRRLLRVCLVAANSAFMASIAGLLMFASNQTNAWFQLAIAGMIGLLERQVAQNLLMKFFSLEDGNREKK
jgi:hypothetical protein